MPSILTHYGFNKEVFDNSIKFLNGNEDIYLVGAQGPDVFFFRGILPSFNNKNSGQVREFGSMLHKKEPSEMFSCFFEYAKGSKHKDVLFSYILGAGLHYILDRKIHPYVFYKTGFSDDKKMKAKYFIDHTLFETHLDVLLMDTRFKEYKVKNSDAIKCEEDKVEEVSEMYEFFAKELIEGYEIDDDTFEDSYEDMIKIEKILYSKRGIKKGICKCLFKNTPLNTMMHPRVVKDDDIVDYLNNSKKEWKDPSSESVYTKSINELIDEAKEEVKEWISIVNKAYTGKVDQSELEEFTKGMIYDGNHKDKKMKVFESVFKRKEKKK